MQSLLSVFLGRIFKLIHDSKTTQDLNGLPGKILEYFKRELAIIQARNTKSTLFCLSDNIKRKTVPFLLLEAVAKAPWAEGGNEFVGYNHSPPVF